MQHKPITINTNHVEAKRQGRAVIVRLYLFMVTESTGMEEKIERILRLISGFMALSSFHE
jgi:hypothetical protein